MGTTHHVSTAPPVNTTSTMFIADSMATIEISDIPTAVRNALESGICRDSTTVSVGPDMQVYEVKELVQKEKGEPVEYLDALRLLRDTVPLEDGRTLSSYGVRAGETLLLSSQDPEIGRAERCARGERALQVSQQAARSAAVRDAPEGWPHLRNAHGCHLYRYQKTESWRLGPTFSPVTDSCNAVRW